MAGAGPLARQAASKTFSAARSRLKSTLPGRIWKRLSELRFIDSSLQFAAMFTLSFILFLMLLSMALGTAGQVVPLVPVPLTMAKNGREVFSQLISGERQCATLVSQLICDSPSSDRGYEP